MDRIERAWTALMLAYVGGVVVGSIARDRMRERARVREVVANVTADLESRADEILDRVGAMMDSETSATYDRAGWGETNDGS